MPDVPKRCWYCERELSIESIRVECAHCGADVARAYEWLDALDAARAEAKRWQARYEALRAGMERVVQDLHERAHAIAQVARITRNWELYGASDAYYEVDRMVRLVRRMLAEAGGGGAVVVLTHDDCNTLMHGLRSREELEGYLLPEALERYQQLVDRIIDVGWAGAEVSRMPNVPERCPRCGSETLHAGVNLYHACGTRSTPGGEVVMEGWECAVRQRDDARAEAERWRKQYEALLAELAAVSDVVEAARRVVNAEHDVDPVDVYYLREAIRRYDERMMAARGEGTD